MVRIVRRKRRVTARAYVILLCCLVALGVYVAATSPAFRLRSVTVHGGSANLFRLTGLKLGTPVYALNTNKAQATLLKKDPSLATATVRVKWPSSVIIDVSVRHSVGVVLGSNGQMFGVDPSGRLLPLAGQHPNLPFLTGVSLSGLGAYNFLPATDKPAAKLLAELGSFASQVSEVHVSRSGVNVVLMSGVDVQLGHGSFPAKLRELKLVLKNFKTRGLTPRVINLAVLGHPSVQLR